MTATIHHYDDSGSGIPIVWIHGFPLSSAIFEPQLAIAGFRHIRPDLPGFGATPPAGGTTSMATYARDVLAVMDSCGIGHAVIGGFSMGGYVAMEIMRQAPERAEALLLLDTRETADTAAGREDRLRQASAVEQTGSIAAVVESMLPRMVCRDDIRPDVRRIMETSSAAGVAAALHALAARPDSASTLRALRVPALVVVGDQDQLTPPSDAERMTSMIPGAELAPIAKAGHMAHFERPEQLNPLIAAFLMRHVVRHEHAGTL